MVAAAFEPGTLVWVACPELVWRAGRVVATPADAELGSLAVECEISREGEAARVTISGVASSAAPQVLRRDVALSGDGAVRFDDLTEVPELHSAELLHALEVRFARGLIYTLTGPVLLAVNPFRHMPGLYDPHVLRSYMPGNRAPAATQAPHIFGVAARALDGIQERGASQSILVSGESGAGKTETTKFVMHFLALAGAQGAGPAAPEWEPCSPARSRAGSAASGGTLAGAGSTSMTPRTPQTPRIGRNIRASRFSPGAGGAGGMSRVERQVLSSNPLLEAFGNAKTGRNDNSSRFGKYIELQFGGEGPSPSAAKRLVGARIRTYLLEKVRVISQRGGERNYHVFYQALAMAQTPAQLAAIGASVAIPAGSQQLAHPVEAASSADQADDDLDLRALAGFTPSSFAYLASAGECAPDGTAEVEGFESTLAAMRAMGFTPRQTSEVFRALAAVLHLGNVCFTEVNSEACEVLSDDPAPREQAGSPPGSPSGSPFGTELGAATDASSSAPPRRAPVGFSAACKLLGVGSGELERALCSRTMQAPGERSIRMTNNIKKAAETRDALAMHLYHAIFGHIVERINFSAGCEEAATFCGVLDIFGFEFFEVNSFEQLCINYTNELLQQHFNTFIFQNEAALYESEGIPWVAADFPDNSEIVVLLHDRLIGILPMLEEECFNVGGSSEAWNRKIAKQHEKHANFGTVLTQPGVFIVRHFAGPVTYTCEGFMEKNRDQLSADLQACLQRSASAFVRDRFLEQGRAFGTSPDKRQSAGGFARAAAPAPRVLRAQRHSVSAQFRQQLQDLLACVQSTEPHFVRCLKPNPRNVPFADPGAAQPIPLFDRPAVAQQLSYQGVLEAIRVARAGFPVRLRHADFLGSFRCLAPRPVRDACHPAGASAEHVRAFMVCDEVRALLAAGAADAAAHAEASGWAVGQTRVFLKAEPYSRLRAARLRLQSTAAAHIQASQRRRAAVAAFGRLRRAAAHLQALARGRAAVLELRRRRRERAASGLGAGLRTLLARRRFAARRTVALAAQSWVRGQRCRVRFAADAARVLRLQRWWRSLRKRRRFRHLQRNILRMQCAWRGALAKREAIERLVARHRLKLALRSLLAIRRRNLERRAWRAAVMAKYSARPVYETPAKDGVVQRVIDLHRRHGAKQAELRELRNEVALWEEAAVALRERAYLGLADLFGQ